MNNILYWGFYILMLIGYSGVSLMAGDIKTKIVGILLVIVNALIFWRTV